MSNHRKWLIEGRLYIPHSDRLRMSKLTERRARVWFERYQGKGKRVMTKLHNLLERLEEIGAGVQETGGDRFTAFCPCHELDGEKHTPSLSIALAEEKDKILIHCFAGCQTEDIVAKLGLKMSDLFLNRIPIEPDLIEENPVTLEQLAKHKRLPVDALKRFGVYEIPHYGVIIPYYRAEGTVERKRIRTALRAKEGSYWSLESDEMLPYGLNRRNKTHSTLFLVEGESDCWTLWYHQLQALGIPGATCAGVLRSEHLDGVDELYIVREADEAGGQFVLGIHKRLQEIHWEGSAFVIDMRNASWRK